MTRTELIDHLKAGWPVTKTIVKEIVAALEEVLRFVHDECDWEAGDRRIGSACIKALEAACQK